MNFTESDIWKQSNKIRFDIDKVFALNNVDFLIKDDEVECLQFFSVNFDFDLLDAIKVSAKKNKAFKFKYINMPLVEKLKLNELCDKEKLKIDIIDDWQAPILELIEPLEKYICGCSNQLKRDYAKYCREKNITYKVFKKSNLQMWVDVLDIDKNSWKGENSCDMKSLCREDLQYVFYLLNANDNSSLIVSYFNEVPVAYSLWFRDKSDNMWYAAKWGASKKGRTIDAGIKTLFYHIEYMYCKESFLLLDFWGRRSRFYDMLKNKEIERSHFVIRGKDDKSVYI